MAAKRKTPQQKKRESYAKDRRNTYGENAKASRKNIPRRKASGRRALRRIAKQALTATAARRDPDIADDLEPRLKRKRKLGFAKFPDVPLGKVIERKRKRRIAVAGRKSKSGAPAS
jgi:hypothetical protein